MNLNKIPSKYVATLHNRMPVILEEEKLWLLVDVAATELIKLFDPFPDEEMNMHVISTNVNTTINNQQYLIYR